MAVASSREGEIWIYDAGRRALLRFDPSGRLTLTLRLDGGAPTSISDLAVDHAGYLFATDHTRQDVKAFGKDLVLTTIRVMGGDRIPWRPGALAIGPGRQIAIADPDRAEIQILIPEPRVVRSEP
jgi:streptogramin lyase